MTNLENVAKTTGYNVSQKYAVINTGTVVHQFETAGFKLFSVSKARVKDASKDGFQRHLLTFRHPDMGTFQDLRTGNVEAIPQILLANSYDGSSAFKLMLGVYRLVCANGLIAGSTFNSISVKHVGPTALQQAVDGAFQVAKQSAELQQRIQQLQLEQMSPEMQNAFAIAALNSLMPDAALMSRQLLVPQLLAPRRFADVGNNAWAVLNRAQENVIRGGLKYATVTERGVRNASTRGVRSIDRNVALNTQLWSAMDAVLGGAA